VLAAGATFWAYSSRTTATLANYVDLSRSSKQALDTISKRLRNAKKVTKCAANEFAYIEPDGVAASYKYDATAGKVWWVKGNERSAVLSGCTNFAFSVYQRTPASNSFNLLTNAWSTNTAKVVQMRWTALRSVTGDKKSLENQVAAKVVLRNL